MNQASPSLPPGPAPKQGSHKLLTSESRITTGSLSLGSPLGPLMLLGWAGDRSTTETLQA